MERDEIEAFGHRLMRAMTERDFATLEALLHPSVNLRSVIAGIDREFTGLDGMRRYFTALDESFGDARWSFEDVVAIGVDVAVVRARFQAHGLASGIEIDELLPQVWEWLDGRGYRNDVHRTVDEALAAAGLPG